jgi:hypothetical protein
MNIFTYRRGSKASRLLVTIEKSQFKYNLNLAMIEYRV